MPINTDYWYHDIDIEVALSGRFAAKDSPFDYDNPQHKFRLTWKDEELEKRLKVTLAVTPAASNQEPFFFLDKFQLDRPVGLDTRRDVFDELLEGWSDKSTVRILFPLNMGGAHWTSVKIDITRNAANNTKSDTPKYRYDISLSHFDPFGSDGKVPEATKKAIVAAIRNRLEIRDEDVTVRDGTARNARRQAIGDGTSCGPITVRDIWELMTTGKLPNKVGDDEPGAKSGLFLAGTEALRQAQLQEVKNSNLDEQAKRDFEARLTRPTEQTGNPNYQTAIENSHDHSSASQRVDYSYAIATSVATIVVGLQDQELKSALRRALDDATTYARDSEAYIEGVYDAVTLLPTTLLSKDDNKKSTLDTDIPQVAALEQLLFGRRRTLTRDALVRTLLRAASLVDFSQTYQITADLTTPTGRAQLNQVLLRILLNVEGLSTIGGGSPLEREIESAELAEATRSFSTYRMRSNNYLRFYNDASVDSNGSAGAFHDLAWALDQARHLIYMVDWSFHPQTYLARGSSDDLEQRVGDKLIRKAGEGVLVAINTWQHPKLGAPDPDNNNGGEWLSKRLIELEQQVPQDWEKTGWNATEAKHNLLWRASLYGKQNWSETWGMADWTHSHHQKFVVLDVPAKSGRTLAVFYGGLDITKGRFDWPGHPLVPQGGDDRDDVFRGDYADFYNGEFSDDEGVVREPWHDIHTQLIGPCAFDFLLEFVGRWNHRQHNYLSYSDLGAISDDHIQAVYNKARDVYTSLGETPYSGPTAPEMVENAEPFNVQVVRSLYQVNWRQDPPRPDAFGKFLAWKDPDKTYEASILQAYMDTIQRAEEFIYIESQYLIGAGKYWNASQPAIVNELPKALVEKIIAKHSANQEFHVYIVLPMFPEGKPASSSMQGVRYLQWETVKYMLRALADAGVRWKDFLSFYCLGRCDGVSQPTRSSERKKNVLDNQRYMIYVHSKFMIVDDKYIIVGSANLNDRSLAGNGDTEIATLISATEGDWLNTDGSSKTIREFRLRLWAEHLGFRGNDETKYVYPAQRQTWELLDEQGSANLASFLEGKRGNHLLKFPIDIAAKGFFEKLSKFTINQRNDEIRFETMEFLPDAPRKYTYMGFYYYTPDDWRMKPTTVFSATDLTVDVVK